jgi:hypothetical protein
MFLNPSDSIIIRVYGIDKGRILSNIFNFSIEIISIPALHGRTLLS